MTANKNPIDVLREHAAAVSDYDEFNAVQDACRAVAELVAADREYDAARAAIHCLIEQGAPRKEIMAAGERRKRAADARAAVLAKFPGA